MTTTMISTTDVPLPIQIPAHYKVVDSQHAYLCIQENCDGVHHFWCGCAHPA